MEDVYSREKTVFKRCFKNMFLSKIQSIEDCNGTKKFVNLCNSVLCVLSLLHSNADSECISSKIKLIKTDLRIRVNVDTALKLILSSKLVKDTVGLSHQTN